MNLVRYVHRMSLRWVDESFLRRRANSAVAEISYPCDVYDPVDSGSTINAGRLIGATCLKAAAGTCFRGRINTDSSDIHIRDDVPGKPVVVALQRLELCRACAASPGCRQRFHISPAQASLRRRGAFRAAAFVRQAGFARRVHPYIHLAEGKPARGIRGPRLP